MNHLPPAPTPEPAPSRTDSIESILQEHRLFPAPSAAAAGVARWLVGSMEEYRALYARSIADPEGFWADEARRLHWSTPWAKVLEWQPPDARWFIGGRINAAYNCLDRQVEAGLGDEPAIIWEGEPLAKGGEGEAGIPEVRRLTYRDLLRESSRLANALKALGVKKGEVVTIYMGMVPELPIALLACARIGAPHSVIFGGFAPQAISDRVADARSRVVITADGAWRRGKVVPLKDNVDQACTTLGTVGEGPHNGKGPAVEHVIVLKRCGNPVNWIEGRDHWWHDALAAAAEACPAEPMDSEDQLFLLYTSGSTGKPKGIVHTTGGYLTYAVSTARYVFNLEGGGGLRHQASGISTPPDAGYLTPHAPSLYWCTADIGWVTGHSYVLYGILPNRVPSFMYEGAPDFPAPDRFWDMIERHRITHLYTAPTAIRAFMKWGDEHPAGHDLSSLRVLGSVGEPINPEAWMWYREKIGGGAGASEGAAAAGGEDRGRCPIVDTWWQTETGGHMITPFPGATPTKPGSCTLPFFGIDAAIVNDQGVEQGPDRGGLLVIRKPWPGMIRAVHGDRERFVSTYFSRIRRPGHPEGEPSPYYFTGDGARRDRDGYFWIMGRVDDVINVAGHRLGTMEIESALVSHGAVVEAAVVGMPHDLKGTGIAAFCTLAPGVQPGEALKKELSSHVAKEIGAIARPDTIRFTPTLPKTRSGKIMRRLLRDLAAGVEGAAQDTTTLEDFGVLAKLREADES